MEQHMHLRNLNLNYADEFEDLLGEIKINSRKQYFDSEVVVIFYRNKVLWIRVNEIIEWLDLPSTNANLLLII